MHVQLKSKWKAFHCTWNSRCERRVSHGGPGKAYGGKSAQQTVSSVAQPARSTFEGAKMGYWSFRKFLTEELAMEWCVEQPCWQEQSVLCHGSCGRDVLR